MTFKKLQKNKIFACFSGFYISLATESLEIKYSLI